MGERTGPNTRSRTSERPVIPERQARRRPATLALRVVEPRPQLPAVVAASITREIAEKRFGPGSRLPTEQALADTFGVSRNVIREAIAQLRSVELVWSRQGRGVFVAAATPARALPSVPPASAAPGFEALFELRLLLEPGLAALAAARRTAADLDALGREITIMAGAPFGSRPWLAADLGFHRALFAAAGNPLASELMAELAERTHQSLLAARIRPEPSRAAAATLREHRAILSAAARGEHAAAARAMRAHLRAAHRRLGGTS